MEVGPRSISALLQGIVPDQAFEHCGARTVRGLCDDSRAAAAGYVFVALRGAAADGRSYLADAVQRGATVVIGEDIAPLSGADVIRVSDARAVLARLAARWYQLDTPRGRQLKLIGITGTNGKSTSTYMTAAILRAAGWRVGMFGTVQYDLCGRTVQANMTTPGPLELAGHLRECLDAGADAVVMEVSSHALDQRRTDGLTFAAAAFTNLTQDHLDYHHTIESYAAAKARLFEGLAPSATAVVNADDPWHERMIAGCGARVLKCSLRGAAEVSAQVSRDSIHGTLYRLRVGGQELVLENALVGRHNVYNAMTAAGLAWALGVDAGAIERGLSSVRNVPGRLQRVMCRPGVEVFVDYAHTDDALRNVLGVLKPLTRRNLIAVFGCGGDRDRTKRPKMARAVAEFADGIIVTSDNPRTEDPQRIIDEILAGFDAAARRKVVVEPDRRAAIRAALAGAHSGDVVLIAGKGHEDYQIIGREKAHFDDVEVALQAAAELTGSAVS